MISLGDFPTSATVYGKWNSNGTNGASITRATDGTLKIYKDGNTNERSSANGITDTEDFDSRTGVHHFAIDLSDNSDSGFYAAGHEYFVYITGATIDGQTVNACIAHFSIERAGGVLALLKAANIANGAIDANVTKAAGTAWGSGAITAASIASDAITAGKIAADAIGASELAADAVTEIVNGILNEVNTGATHNVNNSVGKQIRQASGGTVVTIRSGTAQSGSTANTIKLDAGASATNNIYNGDLVVITGGTGVGQTRSIIAYNGTTKVATVDSNWVTTPDNTSTFDIIAGANSAILNEGVLQSATGTTAVLATTASSNDDVYNTAFIAIVSGTGSGQTREITDYTGSTRTADVAAWSVTPDNTSGYVIVPNGSLSTPGGPTAAQIASAVFLTGVSSVGSINAGGITAASFGTDAIDANALADDAAAEIANRVWEEPLAGHTTDGSAGKTLADIVTSSAPSASDVAFAVWEESLASHGTAGSAGKTLSNLGTDSSTPGDIAAAVWKFNFDGVEGEAARGPLNALRLSRNKWTIVGTTLTVYREDDATIAWTAELVQNTTGRPVSSVDPA